MEASELGAEVVGDVRLGELSLDLARKPISNGCYFSVTGPRVREGVRVENDTLIQEEEQAGQVRARDVGRDADDGAVKWVPVFQPVFKAREDRGIGED